MGRVKTSHAWFVAYAPAQNPEIAAVAFVYGGGEGSLVAAPVVNTILRQHFGFDDAQVETPDDTAGAGQSPLAAGHIAPRFLGSDAFPGPLSAVNGFVRGTHGEGLPGVVVNILAGDELITQVSTGLNGQFDYNNIQSELADSWQIQLADRPDVPPITLAVSPGTRYFIEFQALTHDDS